MLLRPLLTFTCLAALLAAQGESGDLSQAKRVAAGEEEADGKEGKHKTDEEWEKLTPEQRLARNIRSGASGYCRFVVAAKPARLMPGQSGTLVVTAVLQGEAVLPAPAPLEVTSTPAQGLVTLGSATFRPAGPGKLAKGYLGRPVYDNYAIFEIPVTMASNAQLGRKQPVNLEMRFDLYDGNTAQAVGRFVDRAAVEIEVGRSADPHVAVPMRATGAAVPEAAAPPDATQDETAMAVPARSSPEPAIEGVAAVPAAKEEEAPAAVQATEPPVVLEEESGLPVPVPMLVGGGVLLVGLVLLLSRKK